VLPRCAPPRCSSSSAGWLPELGSPDVSSRVNPLTTAMSWC